MRLLILLTVFIIPLSLASQIDWEVNEVDEFKGGRHLEGEWISIGKPVAFKNDNVAYMRFKSFEGFMGFDFKLTTYNKDVSVDAGNEFFFKLDDGSTLKFTIDEPQEAKPGEGSTGIIASAINGFSFTFPLNAEQCEKLSKHCITQYRLYLDDGSFVEQGARDNKCDDVKLYAKFYDNAYFK